LAEVYGWFTEGFDTADLQEARALLEALSQMASYSALLRSPTGKNWPTVLWGERSEVKKALPSAGALDKR
jgi:hypothetical protein